MEEKFDSVTDYTDTILPQLRDTYETMKRNQANMAVANAKRNERLHDVQFSPGDMVWVWKKFKPSKLEWRYQGPFKVIERKHANSYIIDIGTYKSGSRSG